MDSEFQVPMPDPQMASPRNAELGQLSSSTRTLGPLDATLPASIDRYDYSYFAKHGPFASSVPNAFGLESPSSLSSSFRGEALSALRKSAFGEEDSLSGELSRSPFREGLGSFSERTLHSAARRPKTYASSYGGATHMMSHYGGLRNDPFGKEVDDDDLDQNFAFEEDLVPGSLSELLTPAERSRRMSRTDDEMSSSFRNAFASPTNNDSYGSPPIGSPGSWGPIVTRHKREEEPISGIGHVGSPLRNSFPYADRESLGAGARAINRSSGSAPGGGISALTHGLKMSSIHDLSEGSSAKSLERTISNPRLGNGKMIQPIEEEEPEETQFDIEVEEDAGPAKQFGGFSMGGGAGTDGLGHDRFFSGRS